MSAIFISHSTNDKVFASRLLERLRHEGYRSMFLDSDPQDGIKAGVDWERDLYRKLKLSAGVVVICSPDSMNSRWCFAEIAQAKALGKALFPIILHPCEVIGSLANIQIIDINKVGEEQAFQRLLDGLTSAGLASNDSIVWDPSRSPFPGMFAFEATDAGVFFGRGAEIRRTIEALTRMRLQREPRLLLLVGSSGSGKSSIVRAGVLPRLKKDPDRWLLVPPFRPSGGASPLDALRLALGRAFHDEQVQQSKLPGWISTDATSADLPKLEVVADQLRSATGRNEASLLIVVDQAEELLRGTGSSESMELFEALLPTAQTPEAVGAVFVLFTLRSDFLGILQNHPLMRGVTYADLPLGPMAMANLPEIIEGPAARAAIALGPGLVTTMVGDASTDDALPLLAFTLRALWERCDSSSPEFTLEKYHDELGGIRGAVKSVVNSITTDSKWTAETLTTLRHALLKMVTVDEEGDRFIRQRVRWDALPAEAKPVLERFVKERLLKSDGAFVEVAHESLFRVWLQLSTWLDESREAIIWRKGNQDEFKSWLHHNRAADRLLAGARALEAERWLKVCPEMYSELELDFLRRSVDAEIHKRLWLKLWTVIATVAAAVFLLLAGLADHYRRAADTQTGIAVKETGKAKDARDLAEQRERAADSLRLVAQSQATAEKDPVLSLLLASAALQIPRAGEPTLAPLQAVYERLARIEKFPLKQAASVTQLVVAPDGRLITGDADGIVRIWDRDTQKVNPTVLNGTHQGRIIVLENVPKSRLVTGDEHGVAQIWDLKTSPPTRVKLPGETAGVSFSYNEGRLAIADSNGLVKIWNLDTDPGVAEPEEIETEDEGGVEVAFLRDGRLLTIGQDEELVLWSLGSSDEPPESTPLGLLHPIVKGSIVSFSKEQFAALVNRNDKQFVAYWDLTKSDEGSSPQYFPQESGVSTCAFTSEGYLATAGFDGVIRIREMTESGSSGRALLRGHAGRVNFIRSLPDGRLITGGADGIVRIWDLKSGLNKAGYIFDHPSELKGHGGDVNALTITTTGEMITGGQDGTVRTWNLSESKGAFEVHPRTLKGHEGRSHSLCFAPNQDLLTLDSQGTIRRWTLGDRDPSMKILTFPGQEDKVDAIGFLPDHRLVTAHNNGQIVVWDVSSEKAKPLALKGGGERNVTQIAYSSKGKVAINSLNASPTIWSLSEPNKPIVLPAIPRSVSLAFTPDERLITGNTMGTISIWNLDDPKKMAKPMTLKGPSGWIFALGIAPDGRLISSGARGKIRIYDLKNSDPNLSFKELEGHENRITCMAISSNGMLFTGSEDETIRNWSLHPVAQKQLVFGAHGRVVRLAVSADNRWLVAGLYDGRVLVWSLWEKDLLELAGQAAGRSLTRAELQLYLGDKPDQFTPLNSSVATAAPTTSTTTPIQK